MLFFSSLNYHIRGCEVSLLLNLLRLFLIRPLSKLTNIQGAGGVLHARVSRLFADTGHRESIEGSSNNGCEPRLRTYPDVSLCLSLGGTLTRTGLPENVHLRFLSPLLPPTPMVSITYLLIRRPIYRLDIGISISITISQVPI